MNNKKKYFNHINCELIWGDFSPSCFNRIIFRKKLDVCNQDKDHFEATHICGY